ncbi:Glu/Leu/Phe/Val dehydrogenase dimerization domain-containing protein [Sorangium sp. So ce1000]|uniref:Glu/Leu/Phe/Val dehydrogenase dimerization domain-containing protein n=1 Tax=Sorangium sp. So ce1000 TaxID=3133325 RepID=UPI003F623AE5
MNSVLEYYDSETGVRGWLAYDGDISPISAGGCRVQPSIDRETLVQLAKRMTLKQRVLGLNVNGGKCGIALDPRSDDKAKALGGFLRFLRDELHHRFSMGPDMGTQWTELQSLAVHSGIPSVKYAIRAAQGLTEEEFFARMDLLEEQVGRLTLAQRRAGCVLAHTALAAAKVAGASRGVSVALQGFGNLGRAAAASLVEEDTVRVVAVSDEYGCVVNASGLDLVTMLSRRQGLPVQELGVACERRPTEGVFAVEADVLILAANQDALSLEQAALAPIGAISVGSNYGLSPAAEDVIERRGVVVVPDFIGGIGGSASMEALFGPRTRPSPKTVLDSLAHMSRNLVTDLCWTAHQNGISNAAAAQVLADRAHVSRDAPPYGHCHYLKSRC